MSFLYRKDFCPKEFIQLLPYSQPGAMQSRLHYVYRQVQSLCRLFRRKFLHSAQQQY